jgi:hypothetical protein
VLSVHLDMKPKKRLSFRYLGLITPTLRLIGARNDPGEQVAVLDELAFLEVDADQLSRDGL